jgi:hypothetical protein
MLFRVSDGHDAMFIRFARGMVLLLLLYGAGMMVVALKGDVALASRMITGFGTMFAGVLGLGSGYLLGRAGVKPPEGGPKGE